MLTKLAMRPHTIQPLFSWNHAENFSLAALTEILLKRKFLWCLSESAMKRLGWVYKIIPSFCEPNIFFFSSRKFGVIFSALSCCCCVVKQAINFMTLRDTGTDWCTKTQIGTTRRMVGGCGGGGGEGVFSLGEQVNFHWRRQRRGMILIKCSDCFAWILVMWILCWFNVYSTRCAATDWSTKAKTCESLWEFYKQRLNVRNMYLQCIIRGFNMPVFLSLELGNILNWSKALLAFAVCEF